MSAVRGVLRRLRRPAVPVLVITGAVLAMALMGGGNAERALVQSAGSAWVVSPGQGLLSLIDGPSDEIVASVALPGGSEQFEVEQSGSSAYVADVTAGTVAHVDGATGELSQAVQFGTPDGGLSVLQGGEAVFVLDSARRTAQVIDPDTLEVERSLSLTAEPGPGQAVVDDQGRLWVLDTGSRSLTWFDDHKHVVEAPADGDRLILVRGSPVLIDTARARVQPLDDQGRPTATSCLEVRDDEAVELLGSASADEIYAAVPASGNLLLSDVTGNDCERVVSVAEPGTADFGPLAQSGRFVFVPDRAAGRTIVVDTRDDTRAGSFDLVEPGHDVELIAKDGVVFYNDRDGSTAGVLRLQNGIWETSDALQKFNPDTGQPTTPLVPDAGPAEVAPALPVKPTRPADQPESRKAPSGSSRPGQEPAPNGGSRPDPRPSEPTREADDPPSLGAITMSSTTPVLGTAVTFTVPSTGTDGGTWAWALSAASGPVVATAADPGTFTVTLPTDSGLNFVLTLAVRTSAGSAESQPFVVTATDSNALVVAPQPDALARYVGETVTISPGVSGADGGTWTWSASGPAGPVALSQPGPGGALSLALTALGDYTVTLDVTSRGQRAHGSASVEAVEPCTVTSPSPRIDLGPGTNPAPFALTAGSSCLAPVVVTTSGAGWLFDADKQTTIAPGGTVNLTVGLTIEPALGSHPGAITSTYNGVAGPVWDVVTENFPPDVFESGLVECNSTEYGLTIYDGAAASATATIRAGSQDYPLTYRGAQGTYGGYFSTTVGPAYNAAAPVPFRVTVTDSSDATTVLDSVYPVAAGCGVQ